MMNDEQIILLFNLRSEQTIKETEKKHGTICRLTAGRILDNQQDIEECVNDGMMQAWNNIPPQRPLNLAAFLVTITRNIALNRCKHNKSFKRCGGQIMLVLDELCVSPVDKRFPDNGRKYTVFYQPYRQNELVFRTGSLYDNEYFLIYRLHSCKLYDNEQGNIQPLLE